MVTAGLLEVSRSSLLDQNIPRFSLAHPCDTKHQASPSAPAGCPVWRVHLCFLHEVAGFAVHASPTCSLSLEPSTCNWAVLTVQQPRTQVV